jgi:hypothetical protein
MAATIHEAIAEHEENCTINNAERFFKKPSPWAIITICAVVLTTAGGVIAMYYIDKGNVNTEIALIKKDNDSQTEKIAKVETALSKMDEIKTSNEIIMGKIDNLRTDLRRQRDNR